MTFSIPDSHKALLDGPVYVVATTVMPDGQPQSTVVWWDSEGDYVRINTARGRQKEKNLLDNPKITIIAVDPKDPYHFLEVRGVVESISEAGGQDHIEKLSWKYTGQKYYGGFNNWKKPEDEIRLVVNIRPTKIITH